MDPRGGVEVAGWRLEGEDGGMLRAAVATEDGGRVGGLR